jgi:hypothetical protein
MKLAAIVLPILAISAPAAADRITGTFTFRDGDGMQKPIRDATVEIWRRDPGGINWYVVMTTSTSPTGVVDVMVPFIPNAWHSLRVYAENRGAVVYKRDFHNEKFYAKPGGIELPSVSGTQDFSFASSNLFDSNHYNIADAVLRAFDYASSPARRAAGETDTVAQIGVFPIKFGTTFYDPWAKVLRIDDGYAMDDFTIIHEYGHHLEERISTFFVQASVHNGCTAFSSEGGYSVASPELAWMEGFASYFAEAVAMTMGGVNRDPSFPLGSIPATMLEGPSCSGSTLPLASTEVFVGGALFDIIDGNSSAEPADRLCTTANNPTDAKVFRVFDTLETAFPTLQHFVDGWINQGYDLPSLLAAMGGTAAGLALPPITRRYDNSPAANLAIYRPSNGEWWIAGGEVSSPTQWGEPNGSDVPLPRDYDGDGATDIAVYRPSEGNWWVKLSRTGRDQVTQWGAQYDVPLPGDYDGDGEVDYAVYRPGSGEVIVHNDGCGLVRTYRFTGLPIGTPVVGDYNNDGVDDPALYVAQTRTFTVIDGRSGRVIPSSVLPSQPMDFDGTPLVGDFDNDGSSDFATYSGGIWNIKHRGGTLTVSHGTMWDVPAPADYDGDGKTEITILKPNGRWSTYPWRRFQIDPVWGIPGDIPVPAP